MLAWIACLNTVARIYPSIYICLIFENIKNHACIRRGVGRGGGSCLNVNPLEIFSLDHECKLCKSFNFCVATSHQYKLYIKQLLQHACYIIIILCACKFTAVFIITIYSEDYLAGLWILSSISCFHINSQKWWNSLWFSYIFRYGHFKEWKQLFSVALKLLYFSRSAFKRSEYALWHCLPHFEK